MTLAKLALASIPCYIKQTMKLLNTVCNKIDQICRQFIWGSSNSTRKVHLISWNKICSSKKEKGLGFRKDKELNLACMMKLAWGLVSKPNSLWVKVMRSKYGYIENLIPNVRKKIKII